MFQVIGKIIINQKMFKMNSDPDNDDISALKHAYTKKSDSDSDDNIPLDHSYF